MLYDNMRAHRHRPLVACPRRTSAAIPTTHHVTIVVALSSGSISPAATSPPSPPPAPPPSPPLLCAPLPQPQSLRLDGRVSQRVSQRGSPRGTANSSIPGMHHTFASRASVSFPGARESRAGSVVQQLEAKAERGQSLTRDRSSSRTPATNPEKIAKMRTMSSVDDDESEDGKLKSNICVPKTTDFIGLCRFVLQLSPALPASNPLIR